MIHDLKIDDVYLKNLLTGTKRSEIRFNDRDYQKNDLLRFKEYFTEDRINKATEHVFEITHIHSGLGLKEGFVVLSVLQIGD